MQPKARLTLQQIGKSLDLSTATVSLALRNHASVALETRQIVKEKARAMGYIYNRSAASLRTSSSGMIGVGFHDITNPYFAELLNAIELEFTHSKRSILLGTYLESLEKQANVISSLIEFQPDGMIFCVAGGTQYQDLLPIVEAYIPLVQISREVGENLFDFVGSDDAKGTELALQYLFELGHTKIAMIGGNDSISTGKIRRQTYSQIMQQKGLFNEAFIYSGFGTREVGVKAIHHLFTNENKPTAAVCFNDLTAFGVMLGLRHLGLEAGNNFSIIGCDDVKEAALWYPSLTTIQNHQYEMGKQAANLLLKRIKDPALPISRICLRPDLVVRGTTQPFKVV